MKSALVLPLFSEYPLKEYLGIELVGRTLRENNQPFDRIDLNEKLADFLLADSARLQRLAPAAEPGADDVYAEYERRYLAYVSACSPDALKERGLYHNFYGSLVLRYLDTGLFPDTHLLENGADPLAGQPLLKAFLEASAAEFVSQGYDVLLLSVPHAHQMIYALLFSGAVKARRPEIRTVIGGSSVTLSSDEDLQGYTDRGFIDYAVKYSGEDKLIALLAALESGREVDPEMLARREYVDINRQTVAYRSEFDRTSVPVLYSRGCYWGKCSYCNYICLDSGKFTRKKMDVLMGELAPFSGKPLRVSLITESLTPHDARLIAEGILENGLQLRWGSFIRVNPKFDADLFALLKRSGCVFACVGVESANDRILEFLNKGYSRKDVYAFFDAARAAEFRFFQVNFIYGAPVAGLDQELDSIAFISEFRNIIDNVAFFHLEITETSYLGQNMAALGIVPDPDSRRRSVRVDVIPFRPSLSDQEMRLLERAYEIAGEYFKMQDIYTGIHIFLKQKPETVDLGEVILFELQGHCFAGSLKSRLLREIPRPLYEALSRGEPLDIRSLAPNALFVLFELGAVTSQQTSGNRPRRDH